LEVEHRELAVEIAAALGRDVQIRDAHLRDGTCF
jgi:hypothetical protein